MGDPARRSSPAPQRALVADFLPDRRFERLRFGEHRGVSTQSGGLQRLAQQAGRAHAIARAVPGDERARPARLTLRATAAGDAFVHVDSGALGWSLDGGPLDLNLGPNAQIEVSAVPEPGTTGALVLGIGLLRTLCGVRFGRRSRSR